MASTKRARDAENAKRLASPPYAHRHKPETWPYHNNYGTTHVKPAQDRNRENAPPRVK